MVMLDPRIHDLPDVSADSMAMATAYRDASDEDTRSVLNAMSNQTFTLEFYVIPVGWMNSCLPFLLGKTDQRPETKIANAPLLESEHPVSSSSDDDDDDEEEMNERKRRLKRHRWHHRQRQNVDVDNNTTKSVSLRLGLIHEKDFYLIGANTWTLLSSKFGYDVSLPRPCTATTPTTSTGAESKLAVAVEAGMTPVPVPPSGHFSYSHHCEKSPHVVAPQSDNVSEDDDMFPNCDDNTTQDEYNVPTTNDSVLLLPPSTTAASSAAAGRLSPMEYETPKRKRYASGLGNLGNTCFMNSTLQCLSHTDTLRRYFLSGEYKGDLNRDNPLGTGGELATQFADLLEEMWTSSIRSSSSSSSSLSYGGGAVVYPRNFKYALGKHAQQFLGYDQHDSQEFATYLLDALHEDTNRVTKKPYIEKPEQGEDETDVVAADLAWTLHLKREDSRVLENFMGQVKSRVQCPAEGCGRVSTTFDPFMYLSVPIPGATDRSVQVTLVPLSGKNQNFSVTLGKTSTIGALQKKVLEQSGRDLALESTAACDVWNGSVYAFHQPEDDLENIRVTDTTYIYELRNLKDVRREPEHTIVMPKAPENRRPYYQLRYADFNPDTWEHCMGSFVRHASLYNKILNPKRTSFEELVEFYLKVEAFIELCHSTAEVQYACDQYERMQNDDDSDASSLDYYAQEEKEKKKRAEYDNLPSLLERCQSSSIFHKVEELVDLRILEKCSELFRQHMEKTLLEDINTTYRKGLLIQVVMHRKPVMASPRVASYGSTNDKVFTNPLCLRVPPNMTVYGLREELAHILRSSLKTDYLGRKPPPSPDYLGRKPPPSPSEMMDVAEVTPDESNGESVAEEKPHANSVSLSSSFDLGSRELLIMRQIPLTYERKHSLSYKHHSVISRQLGMLETVGSGSLEGHPISLATRDDEDEKQTIAEVVGPFGTVHMNWPNELCNRAFDVEEYEAAEDVEPPDEASAVRTRNAAKRTINVADCIEKYCQMEQLDESEMWYCSRCKEHVRAWKQFHLYRSPPILIVHLKRFQFHSTTHRRDKIDTFIDFPLIGLDLTSKFTNWTEEEKPVYDCYAVSNHYGGLGGGHYTAYALSDEGEWCHFDDSRVTTGVDPKEVVSSAAYVLYYRRRDVVLDGADGTITPPHPAIVHDPFYQATTDNLDVASDFDVDMRSTSSNKTCPSPMGSIDPGDPYENSDSGYDQEISSALMKEDISGLPLQ